jgi:hypothetical protein
MSIKTTNAALLAAVVFAGGATPAFAESGWVIAGEYGQKPNRIVVMIDIGETKIDEIRGEYGPGGQPYLPGPKKKSVNKAVDAAEAEFAAVVGVTTGPFISVPLYITYESAEKPDYSSMTVRNFCDRKINDLYAPFTYWRNDTKSNELSGVPFTLPQEFMDKILNLTCGNAQEAFKNGGFKPIAVKQQYSYTPIGYPWEALWIDGSRPPYNGKRTIAEMRADVDASIASAQAMLGGAITKTEESLRDQKQKMDENDAFWKDQASRRKLRQKTKLNAPLEAWLKKDEEFLVQSLGMPDKAYNAGNTRILFYDSRGNWSQVFTATDPYGNVISQNSKDYYCNLTLELQNNQLIDFRVVGNSCDYGEFAK